MRKRGNRWPRIAGLALATVACLVLAARAEADADRGWRLRIYAAAVDFADSGGFGWGRTQYEAEVGAGFGANLEYRFSRRVGLDLGVLAGASAEFETQTRPMLRVRDTITFTPVTAGVNVHLTPRRTPLVVPGSPGAHLQQCRRHRRRRFSGRVRSGRDDPGHRRRLRLLTVVTGSGDVGRSPGESAPAGPRESDGRTPMAPAAPAHLSCIRDGESSGDEPAD
jgi:hypothetical protein